MEVDTNPIFSLVRLGREHDQYHEVYGFRDRCDNPQCSEFIDQCAAILVLSLPMVVEALLYPMLAPKLWECSKYLKMLSVLLVCDGFMVTCSGDSGVQRQEENLMLKIPPSLCRPAWLVCEATHR